MSPDELEAQEFNWKPTLLFTAAILATLALAAGARYKPK